MASSFVPRAVFPTLDSLPRSYFLGHHRAGLSKMKTLLSSIDLVVECRDYRVPLTSRNPMFEESLAGRPRLLVYTKQDLGSLGKPTDIKREDIIRQWHSPSPVLFSSASSKASTFQILQFLTSDESRVSSLTGSRILVVGMPNVGKSTLLNSLRRLGVKKGKAAYTGAQPGITRKIGTGVKIAEGEGDGEGVYLVDTPGVFVPYVPDSEAMLRLALVGSVKDTIIAPETLADYLLYHLNKVKPSLYSEYHNPTNDISILLEAVAHKTGRLKKGGVPDTEASALWIIQRWRTGHFGRFVLDEVTEEALEKKKAEERGQAPSYNQARKAVKEAKRQKTRQRLAETT
ncbi:GTPase [Patellaria atrata CBS 101060]|uniref:GTPase n=1 Tax=Patellaria atrata CBS 101060 TaxID=1346257 RepID=A0A9P4S5W5_9PEZI|nr:GTPase [Patellaria atrata CBS 101060]